MKAEKCTQGYIKKRIVKELIWLLIIVTVGAGIFLAGYLYIRVRANIFTVLAVLMALPGAKHVVSLIVFLPKKGVSRERYEEVASHVGNGTLYTEYVFTSTEKVMHLDFLLVKNGNILCVPATSRQDKEYIRNYLNDCINKAAPGYHVRLFDKDEDLLSHLNRLTKTESDSNKEKALTEYLYSLAM